MIVIRILIFDKKLAKKKTKPFLFIVRKFPNKVLLTVAVEVLHPFSI